MNIFELTLVVSILTGLIMGGVVGGTFGVVGIILGVVVGLAVSLACYYSVLSLSIGLAKVGRSLDTPPRNRLLFVAWWAANFTSVMMMILAPVGTVALLLLLRTLLKA